MFVRNPKRIMSLIDQCMFELFQFKSNLYLLSLEKQFIGR